MIRWMATIQNLIKAHQTWKQTVGGHNKGLRQKIVSHMINVLKQHSPSRDLTKIKDIALSFEEKTFTAATSQEDYKQRILRGLISIKVADKNRFLYSLPSVSPSVPPGAAENPGDQGSRCPQGQLCKISTIMNQQPEQNAHSYVFQAQSPPANFLELPHLIQEELKQEVPMSNSLFDAQQLILQRRQFLQSQNTFPAQSAYLKLERGQVDVNTWREEIYQWLQTLKKFFLPELRQLYYKVDACLRQIASAPQPQMTAEIEKRFKTTLHCLKLSIMLLEIAKHKIEPKDKQHIAKLEKDLIRFFKSHEEKRSMSSQHQKQLPLPNMNAFQQSSPHPHNQNPLLSYTNMCQSLQLKQQCMTKSHLGEQQYLQGNMQQQRATQKRPREIENMQQPLKFQAHQNSGSHMNLTKVMKVKQEVGNRGTPMQHHFSRQQRVKRETSSSHVSSPQLLELPSIQNPSSPFLIRGGTSGSSLPEMESVTIFPERTTIKGNNTLMEEIRTINRRLMSIYVEICDENDKFASFTQDNQAKIVKCSFMDLATIDHCVFSEHTSESPWPIQPLKLLIPGNYPGHSPLVLDKLSTLARDGDGASSMKNEEDITGKAISNLKLYLRRFEQPLSLEMIADAWDDCARDIFSEYSKQQYCCGTGSFSSMYGVLEKCASAS